MRSLFAGITFSIAAFCSHAMDLDTTQSNLKFVTVKNSAVGELMTFGSMSGAIDGDMAHLTVQLDSIESMIPIRNERMREFLFETASFPEAKLSTKVPMDQLEGLAPGEHLQVDLSGTLELHGKSKDLPFSAMVTRLDDGYSVTSNSPVLINAADFGLDGGIAKLQEIANLKAIATVVPVTFTLVFK